MSRSGNRAAKYDERRKNFGTDDVIPLWIADMDLPVAEPVLAALKKRLEHPFFGYTFPGESVYQAVISYYNDRYDFDVKKEWIVFNHGVNTGNNIAARALGGTIMVATPMYPHINQKLPQEAGKPVIRVPLKQENGLYTFDFEAMEKAVTQDVTTFVLCNPHNPVGRAWTKEELEKMGDICLKHNDLLAKRGKESPPKYSAIAVL